MRDVPDAVWQRGVGVQDLWNWKIGNNHFLPGRMCPERCVVGIDSDAGGVRFCYPLSWGWDPFGGYPLSGD